MQHHFRFEFDMGGFGGALDQVHQDADGLQSHLIQGLFHERNSRVENFEDLALIKTKDGEIARDPDVHPPDTLEPGHRDQHVGEEQRIDRRWARTKRR